MATSSQTSDDFARVVEVANLDRGGLRLEIIADEHERRLLAERLGLLGIEALTATAALEPVGNEGRVRLRAIFEARVVQSCVVTLEPVPSTLTESIDLIYAPTGRAAPGRDDRELAAEVVVDIEAEDPPEPLINGRIDVGAAVAEHLVLAIDPYPRLPGVSLETVVPDEDASHEDGDNPFAVLKRLT